MLAVLQVGEAAAAAEGRAAVQVARHRGGARHFLPHSATLLTYLAIMTESTHSESGAINLSVIMAARFWEELSW